MRVDKRTIRCTVQAISRAQTLASSARRNSNFRGGKQQENEMRKMCASKQHADVLFISVVSVFEDVLLSLHKHSKRLSFVKSTNKTNAHVVHLPAMQISTLDSSNNTTPAPASSYHDATTRGKIARANSNKTKTKTKQKEAGSLGAILHQQQQRLG
jgi:hypothetical protein